MTMPTPASTFSAYGRRRHILQNTPSAQITSTASAKPSTTTQPRTIWRTPTPSLPPKLLKSLSPVLSFTETTLLQSFLLTVFTALLLTIFKPLIALPASLLNRCGTIPPNPTHPVTSFLLKLLTVPCITFTLATRYLLTKTSNTTQLIGTALTSILQTTLLSYLCVGTQPPYKYLLTACTPSTSPLLPKWPDLLPQLLHTVIATPLYHTFTRHAASPPSSLPNRSLPRLLALPLLPTIFATIPVSLIPVLTLFAGYTAFLRSFGAVASACITTFAVLLSWSLQTALHETKHTVGSPEIERERLTDLLTEDAPTHLILPSLNSTTSLDIALHSFPGYTDATGTAWRTLLSHCLHPLTTIRASLQTQPSASLFASSAPVWHTKIPSQEINHAVMACASLARVYEECAQADMYGVVHRTLPYSLAELLRCKVETAAFVSEGGVELGEGLRQFLGVCSTRDMVMAVDDAVSVCVYRIVGAFRGHLGTYLTGGEVEWDRGLNGLLKAFLEYQVP